ncbi:MAG: gamma carbonic anhydrase family protein [Deltaproteobacteria bacterium]|nr:gamma carbonic anhydrase family protein [Deltaproteobacteria bacterium]
MAFYEFEGKRPRVDLKTFVHPEAVLIGDVQIEAGCYLGTGAVLRGDIGIIRIGEGSNVQENVIIHTFPGKTTRLHRETHIGHGSILHGCEIHSQVLVGMGAIIADGVTIHSRCIIGAGCFVPFNKEIPKGSLVIGSPAKIVQALSPEQIVQIREGLAFYQVLAQRYLASFKKIG